jgi:Ca2+-binding RTX toxin-like protein
MSVVSTFDAVDGELSVFGDLLDNSVDVSRDQAGAILVNGGAVEVAGGTPTVANTTRIQAFGLDGDDTMSINESNGALPASNLFGGEGNDTLTGGSGADQLFGQGDNDTLLGRGGVDLLFGGEGNDTLTGGAADDQMFGQGGNDRMIWNPGDASDLMEGGAGTDTAEVNGGNGAEQFTLTANGARVRFDRIDPAPFSIDIGTTENLVLNMNGGDDTFSATGNIAALISVTVDGGAGNDRILGGNGNDILLGGDGSDFIDGQQGADVAFLGTGDDVFQWDPGDGSDVVEGQDGRDTMLFNGSNVGENFEISANGGRARFTRDVANIVMDLNDVERVDVLALSGVDNLVVNDLTATDVREVAINLAESTAAADTVTLQGRAAGTDFSFRNSGATLLASGLGADVQVLNAGAEDLVVASGVIDGGDDFKVDGDATGDTFRISAAGTDVIVEGLATRIGIRNAANAADNLVINGNAGDDTFEATGNIAALAQLVLDGGAGNDRISGGNGNDVLLGGDGDDFIDGQQGADVALMGAGNDVFQWDPGDGSDVVEGQAGTDTLLFNGSAANENFNIAANGQRERFTRDVGNIVMDIDGIERIEAHAGAGNDTIDASGLTAGRATLSLFADDGDDNIIGSAGVDFINGGRGTDTVAMGAGNDRFQWNPGEGNDVVDGQAGFDTHEFNGSAAAENFALQASGNRVLLTRNVGNIVMDQDNIERVEIAALAGADNVQVGDMRGTDVREVAVNFAGVAGGNAGDNVDDTAGVTGSSQSEFISVHSSGDDLVVNGLAAQTRLANLDASDAVSIDGGVGNDVIIAASVAAGVARVSLLGGAGNDTLFAGRGGMSLSGGAGNDLLVGNGGNDVLSAGTGDDLLIGGAGNDLFSGDDDFAVLDFRAGGGLGDRIDLSGVAGIDDFGDVLSAARTSRIGVVLDFGDDEITLLGVGVSQLHADDFVI